MRERSRADGNWHIEGYALGSSEGSLQINVMVSDQFSSFLEPDHDRVKKSSIAAKVSACVMIEKYTPFTRERNAK